MQSYSDSELRKAKATICRQKLKKRDIYKKLKYIVETRRVPELQERRLLEATTMNNVERVENLLKEGVDANSRDVQCRSALHIACSKGYADIVTLLLNYGANPNIKDVIQNTPLHLAACTSNLHIIQILINSGANIKVYDMHGKTPLQLADSKLQILKQNWKNGAIEMKPIRAQMQQIVDIMIALWKRKEYQPIIEECSDIEELQLIKCNMDESTDAQIDDQFSKLLADLQHFTIK